MTGSSRRHFPSWIESWLDATDHLPSPRLFRRWAGIAAVAGAMERKLWITAYQGKQTFANMYTILVGPPGVGKSVIITEVEPLWRKLPDFKIAPSSVTAASLVDAMATAQRKIVRIQDNPPHVEEYNSLLICSSELGNFIPSYDSEFMNLMQKAYDCELYEQTRRVAKIHIKMDKTQLNLLAGTTPSFMTKFFADGTWDQGFMSRSIVVYSGEVMMTELFLEDEAQPRNYDKLAEDLQEIAGLFGKMSWTEESKTAFMAWRRAGQPPVPEHPRLLHYNSRRAAHLLKLCMVASASRSNDLIITVEDYQAAQSWLSEVEVSMPDIFKAMSTGGDDSQTMDETFQYIFKTYMKEGQKPIAQYRVVEFVRQRVPTHSVFRIIQVMVMAKMIEETVGDNKTSAYKPVGRQLHTLQ